MIAIAILATVTTVTTLVAYSYYLREREQNEYLTIQLDNMTECRDAWMAAHHRHIEEVHNAA